MLSREYLRRGSSATAVGQIAVTTNGADTGEQDINDSGTVSTQPITAVVTIGANGRATNMATALFST